LPFTINLKRNYGIIKKNIQTSIEGIRQDNT